MNFKPYIKGDFSIDKCSVTSNLFVIEICNAHQQAMVWANAEDLTELRDYLNELFEVHDDNN